MLEDANLLTIYEASKWASDHLKREISPQNINYLVQYGQIKHVDHNGSTHVYVSDLKRYYVNSIESKRDEWKLQLGSDINWDLSFEGVKERDRTKHVHRFHPYKGKFIPQLVEYFLDDHIDDFKKVSYFQKGDIILDPFCGSGTTLVQANELGINAVGIDISEFNSLISNVKIGNHNNLTLANELNRITISIKKFIHQHNWQNFDNKLLEKLSKFNHQYFPSPEYRYKVRQGEINQYKYAKQYEDDFHNIFSELVNEYNLNIHQDNKNDTFLDKWYLDPVRKEIDYIKKLVDEINDPDTRDVVNIILSRTIRSCRATTHADLATLKEPVTSTYYCRKHYKICKPIFSILGWWERYSEDTLVRLYKFSNLKTNTFQYCITNDSRVVDITGELEKYCSELADLVMTKKINGIFTSPPYIGLIDYHEQHAYAYDIFNFVRRDELEIGPLYRGKGVDARKSYVEGIAKVFINCKKYLTQDSNIFIVANDKFKVYPKIAEIAELEIINKFRRPVLHRTEKDKSAYAETIFHMKPK